MLKRLFIFLFLLSSLLYIVYPTPVNAVSSQSHKQYKVQPRKVVIVADWKPDFTVLEKDVLTLYYNGKNENAVGFQTRDDLPGYMGLYENTGGLSQTNTFRFWFNGNTNNPGKGIYKGHFFIDIKDKDWQTIERITVPVIVILK